MVKYLLASGGASRGPYPICHTCHDSEAPLLLLTNYFGGFIHSGAVPFTRWDFDTLHLHLVQGAQPTFKMFVTSSPAVQARGDQLGNVRAVGTRV